MIPRSVALTSLPTLLAVSLLAGLPVSAQVTTPVPKPPPPLTPVLQTGTQLVVVDVMAQDRNGNPITSLKATDFSVSEGHAPETIKSFEEHSASAGKPASSASMPSLPQGTFTDFRPVPADETLNVILLDTLNTPMTDQTYVRLQLKKYLDTAPPGKRLAIFGLNGTRLVLLQGFSTDPALLKAVVDRKLIPRGSALLPDSSGLNQSAPALSEQLAGLSSGSGGDLIPVAVLAAVKQFEAEDNLSQTQLRVEYTISAFEQIARYLAPYPGRKNLIWFSGSFPLAVFGDSSLPDPFEATSEFASSLREMTSLLARSRIAVYPVDARGVQTTSSMDASQQGGNLYDPRKNLEAVTDFSQNSMEEHNTMQMIAEDTGGHAFVNTNGLADAVTKSIHLGGHYYTLAYSPMNRNWNGAYRHITVRLNPEAAAKGFKLSYRTGYYAYDPNNRKTSSVTSIVGSPSVSTPKVNTVNFARASMQLGAPPPSEIVFKVKVQPASKADETALVATNLVNPKFSMAPPYRRYTLDLAAPVSNFTITKSADGHLHGGLEYLTYVYDADGRLLNQASSVINLDITSDTYMQLMQQGVGMHQEVSVPARGESFLRIAIHDVPSGRMGVVEVPTSVVASLPVSSTAEGNRPVLSDR